MSLTNDLTVWQLRHSFFFTARDDFDHSDACSTTTAKACKSYQRPNCRLHALQKEAKVYTRNLIGGALVRTRIKSNVCLWLQWTNKVGTNPLFLSPWGSNNFEFFHHTIFFWKLQKYSQKLLMPDCSSPLINQDFYSSTIAPSHLAGSETLADRCATWLPAICTPLHKNIELLCSWTNWQIFLIWTLHLSLDKSLSFEQKNIVSYLS